MRLLLMLLSCPCPASAGLFLVRFRTVLIGNVVPLAFVIYRANRATVVTSKAEEYRAKARECEENAAQTRDPFIKQQFINTAQQWRDMAAYEEKHWR
jgi:hypothetical protein